MSRRVTLAAALALGIASSPAASQTRSPRRLGYVADTIPDISNRLIAVYGVRPLNDSAAAVLRRMGLRVADRSPGFIERAQREHRRLEAATIAVLVEVRPDSMVSGPILVASLLDVMTMRRLRLSSALLPPRGPWGVAMTTALTQLLERGAAPR
jgi:hypothetical protein